MAYSYNIVGMQILGQRDVQEDNYIISYVDETETNLREATTLIAMADGMGGHAAGDIASRIAADTFISHFSENYEHQATTDLLQASLDASNNEIRVASGQMASRQGMGCTFIGTLFEKQYMWWVSVGDSHIYLIRDNQIFKKNEDHSYGAYIKQMQAEGKEVTDELHQNSNVLLSALDGKDLEHVDLPQQPLELAHGDRIIIASDGLNTLRLGMVLQLSEIYEDTQQYVEMLLEEVESANDPKQDNTTIIVVDVHEAEEVSSHSALAGSKQRVMIVVALVIAMVVGGGGWFFLGQKSKHVIEEIDDYDPVIDESGHIIPLEDPEVASKVEDETSVAVESATAEVPAVAVDAPDKVNQPAVEVDKPLVTEENSREEQTMVEAPSVSDNEQAIVAAPIEEKPSLWQRFKNIFKSNPKTPEPISKIKDNAGQQAVVVAVSEEVEPVVTDTTDKVEAQVADKAKAAIRPAFKRKKFRKRLTSGGRGPLMVTIPSGEFMMGTGDILPYFDERPQHKVKLKAFAIGVYEVTLAEYNQFARLTGRKVVNSKWSQKTYPVSMVSWYDANAYSRWLSKQTQRTYRLPTEAEWEYVIKAGTNTRFWWGNEVGTDNARCFGCEDVLDPGGPAKVDSFRPNPFGVYNMVGNVAEWISDCYQEDYSLAFEDGRSVQSADRCEEHVVRGSSFSSPPHRSMSKRGKLPSSTQRDSVGFRVVQELQRSHL